MMSIRLFSLATCLLGLTLGGDPEANAPSTPAPWADQGLTTFKATLKKGEDGSGYGLRLYQRWEEYSQPSLKGDGLFASTAVFPAVVHVAPDSPAARAGIQKGDQLLTINGESVSRQKLDDIGGAIKVRGGEFDALFWRRAPYWWEVPGPDISSYVISVVAYNRPDYLRQVVAALGQCRGIEKYTVMFFLEPGNAEVVSAALEFQAASAAARVVVHVNPINFGFPHNLRQALEVGFTQAEFVILVEDDIVLAPDALEYIEWARFKYAEDTDVFTVSAYGDIGHAPNVTAKLEPGEDHRAARRGHFTPWGWGMWLDRYIEIAHIYTGWDAQMNFRMAHLEQGPDYSNGMFGLGLRKARKEVFPLLSRANNIGFEGGIHAKWFDKDKMKEMQYLFHNTAAEVKPGPGSFHELKDKAELAALCLRCAELECGRDTTRGMCDELGIRLNEKESSDRMKKGLAP